MNSDSPTQSLVSQLGGRLKSVFVALVRRRPPRAFIAAAHLRSFRGKLVKFSAAASTEFAFNLLCVCTGGLKGREATGVRNESEGWGKGDICTYLPSFVHSVATTFRLLYAVFTASRS